MFSYGTDKTRSALKAIVLATPDDTFEVVGEEWAVTWSFDYQGEAHSYVFIHSALITEDGGYGLVDKEEIENKDFLEEKVLHELVHVHIFANNNEDNDDHRDQFKKAIIKALKHFTILLLTIILLDCG
jgi:hypothetical protein